MSLYRFVTLIFRSTMWRKVGNSRVSPRLCANNPHTLTFDLLEKQIHPYAHIVPEYFRLERTQIYLCVQNETNSQSNTTWTVNYIVNYSKLHCVQCLSHQATNNVYYYSLSTDRRVQDEVNMLWEGDGHSSLED